MNDWNKEKNEWMNEYTKLVLELELGNLKISIKGNHNFSCVNSVKFLEPQDFTLLSSEISG